MFFVNFVPEEGRWYCSAPTATGVQRIPVSIDASPFEAFTVSMDEQGEGSGELKNQFPVLSSQIML